MPHKEGTSCVVCNADPGTHALLAAHYTEFHSADILKTFDVRHWECSDNPIRAGHVPDQERGCMHSQNQKYKDKTGAFSSHMRSTRSVSHQHGSLFIICGQKDCGHSFQSIVDYKEHHTDAHSEIPMKKAVFRCHICSKMIKSYESLTDHLDNNLCRTCIVCNATLESADLLAAHLRICLKLDRELVNHVVSCCEVCGGGCKDGECRNPPYTVSCLECAVTFVSKESLRKHHILYHKKNKPFECGRCKASFTSKSLLDSHRADAHDSSYPKLSTDKFFCPLCRFSDKNFAKVCRHARSHLHVKYSSLLHCCVRCTLCEFECNDPQELYQHMEEHTSYRKTNCMYVCNICSVVADSLDGAWKHASSHKIPYDSPFTLPESADLLRCRQCAGDMRSMADLISHINQHKEGNTAMNQSLPEEVDETPLTDNQNVRQQKKLSCAVCEFSCRIPAMLKRHLLTHFKGSIGASARQTACCFCNNLKHSQFESHIRKEHFKWDQQIETCLKCNMKVHKKEAIKHASKHYSDYEKSICLPQNADPLRCRFCGETERNLLKIAEHSKGHRKSSDTHEFTYLQTLQYPCPICDHEGMKAKVKIETHIRTHFKDYVANADIQTFVCTLCITSYPSRGVLYNHILRYHLSKNGRRENCRQCSEELKEKPGRYVWDHVLSHQKDYTSSLQLPEHMESFQCRLCGGKERSVQKLLEHSYQHGHLLRSSENVADSRVLLRCLECKINFDTQCHQQYHNAICHSNMQLCIFCDAKFAFVDDLKDHLIDIHEIQDRTITQCCILCQKPVNNLEEIAKHVTEHNPSFSGILELTRLGILHCGLCKQLLKTWGDYFVHGRLSDNLFKCVICYDEFASAESLKEHLQLHKADDDDVLEPQVFACSCCGFITDNSKSLYYHGIIHQRQYHCIICCKPFDGLGDCEAHLLSEHGGDDNGAVVEKPPQNCVFCFEIVSSISDMVSHMKAHYDPATNAPRDEKKCGSCLEVLSSLQQAHVHCKKHSDDSTPDTECVLCYKRITGKTQLFNHLRTHFTVLDHDDVRVKCTLCDYENHFRGLLKHCMREHNLPLRWPELSMKLRNGYKPVNKEMFTCDLCGFQRKTKSGLNSHIVEEHLGHGPYNCEHCQVLFDTKVALLEHLNSLVSSAKKKRQGHSLSIRGKTCEGCGKVFPDSYKLKRHLKSKPILFCDLCDYKTHGGGSLRIHIEESHVDDVSEWKEEMLHGLPSDKPKKTSKTVNTTEVFREKKCDFCDWSAASSLEIRAHIHDNHLELVTCEICGLDCLNEAGLDNHFSQYFGKSIYKCEQCDFQTHDDEHLINNHLVVKHGANIENHKKRKIAYIDTIGDDHKKQTGLLY